MIPVKICGITSLKDAILAINYGTSAIGMIFYKDSPRYIPPQKVGEWISKISRQVKKVGVFVNESSETIKSVADELTLDYIQLHGDESPEFCENIKTPIIKVFRVDSNFSPEVLNSYPVHAFLFDTYVKGKFGGTSQSFNFIFKLQNGFLQLDPVFVQRGVFSTYWRF